MSTRQMKLLGDSALERVASREVVTYTRSRILEYSYCPLRLTIFPYLEFTASFLPFQLPIDKYVDK